VKPNELLNDMAFPFGPGFPLIRLQALGTGPVQRTPSEYPLQSLTQNARRGTHPDIASLVDPLFACGGKRVR